LLIFGGSLAPGQQTSLPRWLCRKKFLWFACGKNEFCTKISPQQIIRQLSQKEVDSPKDNSLS
jgi:hypothetical protein